MKLPSKKIILASLATAYIGYTLPSALLLGQSEFYRFVTIEQLSHKISHFRSPDYVFIGDSITAGGRNWWTRLNQAPFSTINLGNSGYTVRQVNGLLLQAIQYSPKAIFVMAGTNDLFDPSVSNDDIKADWLELVETAQDKKFDSIIVTGIPIVADKAYDSKIEELNIFLKDLCIKNRYNFIDLNQSINQSINQ